MLFENKLMREFVQASFEEITLATKTNPFTFLQQVRAEVAKVVWPTRRETGVTTVMTLVLVFIFAVFFFVVDQVLSYGTGFLFG